MRCYRVLARGLVLVALFVSATSDAAPPWDTWQWDVVTPDLFPRADLVSGAIRLSQLHIAGKDQVRLSSGTWVTVIEPNSDGELAGEVMVVDGDRAFVASYNRISSGCELAAFSTANGAKLWSVNLDGIGPITHSKYSNRVQLKIVAGKPTVFGSESGGRFVEAREPATGNFVSNVRLAATWPEQPIAEELYRELDNMLAAHASYDVSVNDFLARVVRMTDADHTARGAAFAQAVSSLQHLPLQHGKFTLELQLVDAHGDFTVKAKRVAN